MSNLSYCRIIVKRDGALLFRTSRIPTVEVLGVRSAIAAGYSFGEPSAQVKFTVEVLGVDTEHNGRILDEAEVQATFHGAVETVEPVPSIPVGLTDPN